MKAPTIVLLTALAGLASAAAITQPAGLVERDCQQRTLLPPITLEYKSGKTNTIVEYGACKVAEDCCGDLVCFTHTQGTGICADIPSA